MVSFETYPTGMNDFAALLSKVQESAPDLLVTAAVRIDDLVMMVRQMRAMNFDTKMVSSLPYGLLPEFYQLLGKDAEFVYSATFWVGACQIPAIWNSSRHTKKSSTAPRPFNRPIRMRVARFLPKRCDKRAPPKPKSSARRSCHSRPSPFSVTSQSISVVSKSGKGQ